MPKRTHDGLKKRCKCSKRQWAKCSHGWHFGFHRDGKEHRYSLDVVARSRGLKPPTSKTAAEALRDTLRGEIRNRTFAEPAAPKADAPADTRLTFGDVADKYVEKHVKRDGRREAGRKLMEWYVAALRRADIPAANGATVKLEQKAIGTVTKADVEAIRDGWNLRASASKGGRVGAARALKRLRHVFNWAIEAGYADASPFKKGGVAVIHFSREKARTRRLEPGEEARLLKHAPAHLQALITAALETGMRRGELLALRWRDVKWETQALLLPAEITKTDEARDVPMTQRLRAVLELRKHAPDGTEHPAGAFVFGNDVGEQVTDIRTEWVETCEAATISGLHFHDLRREFASRLRETPGISDHHVRDWLGHADMATTSKYLATTRVGLQQARRVFEQHRAGFAHDSHTAESDQAAEAPETATENPANSLN
ncbi:MAG TPA: site-specific integrase [Vicinamibacterales bacterium]|nr:site-specific integrase [Vicinamibacterales bacterium]